MVNYEVAILNDLIYLHAKAFCRCFSCCCVWRSTDNRATMSLLNCENSCGSNQSSSDCCAAMAASCSAAVKDDSVSGSASTGNLSSSFMEEIQGYDVEFDPPLESKYECPICLMALREAVQTPCGHRFCKACIIKSIRYLILRKHGALQQPNVKSMLETGHPKNRQTENTGQEHSRMDRNLRQLGSHPSLYYGMNRGLLPCLPTQPPGKLQSP